jgi:3-hydroxybutyryl-CoA dehydrogenase
MTTVVAVIAGGRMGAGTAQVLPRRARRSPSPKPTTETATAARDRVARGLAKAAKNRSLVGEVDMMLNGVHTVTALPDLPADADLVIEAVPERIVDKIAVLSEAEKIVGPDAVLASNISSLSITDLAAVAYPHRFLGMHFFNPVPTSRLIEVVRGPEEGVADATAIDRAMELGYRHATGPLRSTDLVGRDVRLAIAEHLHATLGERFAPPQLLRDNVSRGELGRKSGLGFYAWPRQEGAS